MIDTFTDGETLRVYFDGFVLFRSGGSWLHPLFDLDEFLSVTPVDRKRLFLVDTVTGKAAAILLKRIGISALHAGIMSRLACAVCEREGIRYRADMLVDRIECETETILERVDDIEEAYTILAARAQRNRPVAPTGVGLSGE